MIDSPNREMGQLGKRKDRKQVKISVANAVPWPTVSSRARVAQILQEDLTERPQESCLTRYKGCAGWVDHPPMDLACVLWLEVWQDCWLRKEFACFDG